MVAAVRAAATPAAAADTGAPADTWAWLGRVLWDEDGGRVGPAPEGALPKWFATMGPDGPRLLVPAGPRAALRASLRRHHDGHSVRERATRVVAATVAPFTPERFLAPVVHLGDSPSPLLDEVADLLGVPDPRFALTLGPPRGNRKVVVQVLHHDGRIAGFAKVGHDTVTRALVTHELEHLTRLDGNAGRLRTPRVLGRIVTPDRTVAVVGHLPGSAVGRRRTEGLAALGAEVLDASGSAHRTALAATAWAEATLAAVTAEPVHDLLGRWAERPVLAGLAHGDLSPWNVLRARGSIGLIDWEYALDGTPEGLDVLRGETQSALHLLGLDAPAALTRSQHRARHLAARDQSGGLPADDLFRLHLADTLRRAADDSAGDVDRTLADLALAALHGEPLDAEPTDAAPTEVPAP